MTARPYRRTAPTAAWSFRAALLPIPLLVLVGLLRHFDRLDLTPAFLVITLAWGLAAVAVLLGGVAFLRIWRSGALGFRRALAGTLLGLLVLGLPVLVVVEMVRLPRLADISTSPQDPPLFVADAVNHVALTVNPADLAAQLTAYPDLASRHYPLSPERVFLAVDQLVQGRGWRVVDRRPPDADNALGQIQAEASTLGFAFPVRVVVRLEADEDGTLVDMRSASEIGAHDLGDNARRIRAFMDDLDLALQGVTETTASDTTDEPPAPPLPQAAPR